MNTTTRPSSQFLKEKVLNEALMTTKQVAEATHYSVKSIYNKVYNGTFIEGLHYYKPTKRKLLFRRSAIAIYLMGLDANLLDNNR